jgi:hypothetical protein
LPTRLKVTPRGYSKRLQRVLTDFGCEKSFVKAAGSVLEHYGFEISPTTVRLTTLTHAQRAQDHLSKEYEESFRVLPEKGQEHIIAEADGTMICTVSPGPRKGTRPRDWKEMRLAAARGKDCADTVYAAAFAEVDQVGRLWGHCAKQAGRGQNSKVHAVGDGAEWIQMQTREVFGLTATFLCDFYHVSEYLAEAAPTCRSARPDYWRRVQQARLKRGQPQKVIDELVPYLEPTGTCEDQAPVQDAHRYLTNRIDCLDYPAALQQGLPIGSGMIESGHKHILHARLKTAGAAWLMVNANSIAHLRVLRANRKWREIWN